MTAATLTADSFSTPGCACEHCDCDCFECLPSIDWLISGDWTTDRYIALRSDILPAPSGAEVVDASKIGRMMASKPSAVRRTHAHFQKRYLNPIEAIGLRVVPQEGGNSDQVSDAEPRMRFHLILDGNEVVGMLMPVRYPTDKTRRAGR